MIPLFIILAQSVTGAVILIIALLLVAAVIGYLTSWFYAKSVYTPIIKGLEEDKENLIRKVEGLQADVTKLKAENKNLGERISKLEADIAEKDKEINKLKEPSK